MSVMAVMWCLVAAAAATAVVGPADKETGLGDCAASVFGKEAEARIVVPGDSSYTDARMGESIQFEQMPRLIAYIDEKTQVAPLIERAKQAGIKAVPQSGGHHFMAYSALNDSLVIDVTHMDRVRVSADGASARVGAGIRLGALYTALGLRDRDWPGGICPKVGLFGFLGAGGFNMQIRALGLGADHVLGARVVLASGAIVDASPTAHADLFWALCGGGGGSYGIVVEWTLRLQRFPASAMVQLRWDGAGARVPLAQRFLDWAPRADPRFTSSINVYKNRTEVLGWCLCCSELEARALVNQSGLLPLGGGASAVHIAGGCGSTNARMFGYAVSDCLPDRTAADRARIARLAPLGLNVAQQAFAPLAGLPVFSWRESRQGRPDAPPAQPWPRFRRLSKSFFVQKQRPLTVETPCGLVSRLDALPDEAAAWGEWHAWNISGAHADAAFAWRHQAAAQLEFILTGSPDPATQQRYRHWAGDLERFLRPRVGPASYPGYMDASISTDPLHSYYGANVPQLSAIKRKYDPSDFFDNPLSIQ